MTFHFFKSLFKTLAILLAVTACEHAPIAPQTTSLALSQTKAETIDLTADAELIAKIGQVPTTSKKPLQRVGFGSCADPRRPQEIWSAINRAELDLFLATGDNVYASRKEDRPMSHMYALQSAIPEYQAFRNKIPVLATWDDHDYGLSDGGKENPEKESAKSDFLKYFKNDAALIPPMQEGLYHSARIGPRGADVLFIFLDTRWFRDGLEKNEHPQGPLDIYQPTANKAKTFLGEQQWTWLEKQLKLKARLVVIVSSIQFLPTEHGFEKWANFPHERERMFALLTEHKKNRSVLFLSGDRHQAEFMKLSLPKGPILYELTSSGLNKTSTLEVEKNAYRIGEKYNSENFGVLSLDWKSNVWTLALHNIKGELIQKISDQIK